MMCLVLKNAVVGRPSLAAAPSGGWRRPRQSKRGRLIDKELDDDYDDDDDVLAMEMIRSWDGALVAFLETESVCWRSQRRKQKGKWCTQGFEEWNAWMLFRGVNMEMAVWSRMGF